MQTELPEILDPRGHLKHPRRADEFFVKVRESWRIRGGCAEERERERRELEMKRNKTEGVPRSGNSFNPVS